MIIDQQTNTIYFSHMLEQVCPDLYRSISALKEKGYPIEFFQGAKDMWARDYMPIQVAPDKECHRDGSMTSTPSVTVDSITVLRNGIFLVASQEIICNSGRQQTKSLTKILDENALEYLASRKGFILDRLRLDILTIIFRI